MTSSRASLLAFVLSACGRSAALAPDPSVDAARAMAVDAGMRALPQGRVFIGPDVRIAALCSGRTSAPIASVDNVGGPPINWRVSVTGDPAFSVAQSDFSTTSDRSPQIGQVIFRPPQAAVPGDTFEGVATVTSLDGAFAAGTVQVRAVVVPAQLTVDRATLEFGDVPDAVVARQTLRFHNLSVGPVVIIGPPDAPPFNYFADGAAIAAGTITDVNVTAFSRAAGDFSTSGEWSAQADQNARLDPRCVAKLTIGVHARIVAASGADAATD